jgi:phytol kinase
MPSMALLITIVIVLAILVCSELYWRKHTIHDEFSRKFVHITVGSFVAFWPYFLDANQIRILSIAFLLGVAVSRYVGVFSAIHTVQRPTWGEVWFALVVGILAFSAAHPHIYTAALLIMSLADGLAAVIGTRYGNASRYTVFGSPKSVIGTATFFAVSVVILIIYAATTPDSLPYAMVVPVAAGAALLENIGINGFDNLFVPLFVAGILRLYG